MNFFSGIAASRGIAIGKAHLYNYKFQVPKYNISDIQIDAETDRFYDALRKVEQDYKKLKMDLEKEASEDTAKLFDGSILLTKDHTFINEVLTRLREDKKNIEWIVYDVSDTIFKKLIILDDEFFRDRAVDFLNFGKRLVNTMLLEKSQSLADIDSDVIVVSNDLAVSDTANMNRQHVLGILTELGGATSHVAIVAKSLKIPAVLGVKDICSKIKESDLLIVDGYSGKTFINPDEKTLIFYKKERERFENSEKKFLSIREKPSVTLDNRAIALKVNMEIPYQEIDLAMDVGSDGVGLYRSEFLYLSNKDKKLPSEEQQFNAYKFILEKFSPKPVTIRTIDLGGDKILEGYTERELNPYLGYRAIRLSLDKPKMFRDQLRALYRASIYGNLQIMFPMITGVDELAKIYKEIQNVKKELTKNSIPFSNDVKVGTMIETPSAAMLSDFICAKSDFVSIGSNDLVQYTLAVDRNNDRVSYLYQPLHPSVIRMLKLIIDGAHKANIKVSVCGEMGGDMKGLLIFIGLGIDEVSTGVNNIDLVKKIIRSVNYSEVKDLVDSLFIFDETSKIEKELDKWISKHLKHLI